MGLDWVKTGAWLNPGRVRAYLILLALANLLSLGWLLFSAAGGLDPQGRLLGTDFVSFWAAGQVLLDGGNPYHAAVHAAVQERIWPGQTGYTAFFYPPLFLPWCWPLGFVGYFPALAGWLAITGAAYVAAIRCWSGRINWLALAAFPPVLITLTHGQTAFLLAAMLGAGFWAAASGRSALAGILFGLAVFKPQFGVLVPVALLASREWRVIGWAMATALASAALVTLAFGGDLWTSWLAIAAPAQAAMANGVIGFAKMQSLFAAARLLGASAGLAYVLQVMLAVTAAVALAIVAWRRGLTLEVGAAALAGSLLATPFVLDYDFAVLAFPLVLLARGTPLPWERTVAALAFAMPAFARPLAMATGIPLGAVVVTVLFGLLIRRAAIAARTET
jgi:hypothetical protein